MLSKKNESKILEALSSTKKLLSYYESLDTVQFL